MAIERSALEPSEDCVEGHRGILHGIPINGAQKAADTFDVAAIGHGGSNRVEGPQPLAEVVGLQKGLDLVECVDLRGLDALGVEAAAEDRDGSLVTLRYVSLDGSDVFLIEGIDKLLPLAPRCIVCCSLLLEDFLIVASSVGPLSRSTVCDGLLLSLLGTFLDLSK
eukprot:GILJ01020893.1.p2 GENE.GILJ01020893.1~~GILJ01020893.1.p2  ORF type:complete len:166 (-),score=18.47 GILJ01020893.1:193-690(-)